LHHHQQTGCEVERQAASGGLLGCMLQRLLLNETRHTVVADKTRKLCYRKDDRAMRRQK